MALPETIVLSLPDDVERRDHIRKHFETIGIENYRFANAIAADSDLVSLWYATDRVKSYPPCFRCGHVKCDCENNILIPAQVANCISFAQIWASLPKDPTRLYMICEDDVLFFPGAVEKLKQFLDTFQSNSQPTLIRLSESGLPTDQIVTEELITTDQPVMSNPAYIINGSMAQYLTDRFKQIETTSDIWLHELIASQPNIQAMTIKPCLATELSYNVSHARFSSNIHPKGINQEDLQRKSRHIKGADSPMAYENLRAQWSGSKPTKQWNYLASEPFQMRYMLTASLLRKHENILEIGAYKTPLYKFLEDQGKKVRCIDPLILQETHTPTQWSEPYDYRCIELDPFGGQPYALVIMGLDLPITYKLKHYLQTAEAAVIEFPEDAGWKRSRETFDQLVLDAGLTVLSQVHMDFKGNDFSEYQKPNEWPPRVDRYVFLVSAKYKTLKEMESANPFVTPAPVLDTSTSRLINTKFIQENILPEAAFDFSHGAAGSANYLGGGLLYYTLAYMLQSRVCVCLGSGGGLVPRLMRQAQRDIGLGKAGRTILIDGDRGNYGRPNWLSEDSTLRTKYPDIEICISDTVEAAEQLKRIGTTIDYLHIDADHSAEGSLRDFDAYQPLMHKNSVITFHDTRPNAHASTTCWKTIDDIKNRGFEIINMPYLSNGVAIIRVINNRNF